MGQIIVKPTEGIQDNIINYEKSGDTYLLLYKQLPMGSDLSQRKRSHMALVVDVEGKSNDSVICGEQLHLGADTATCVTEFIASYIKRERSSFYDVVYLGKLHNPYSEAPATWAHGLSGSALELFQSTYRGHAWSTRYNCQAFAKELVQKWGLEWKSEIVVAGEEIPVIMDTAILLMAVSDSSS